MRRLAVVGGGVLALAGCALWAPVEPAGPDGDLVLDVTNASGQDRSVGYEIEIAGGSEGAETIVDACRREAIRFGSVPRGAAANAFQILLDGQGISDLDMPLAVRSFVVIRVTIGPAGEVDVDPPVVVADAPNASAAIAGC